MFSLRTLVSISVLFFSLSGVASSSFQNHYAGRVTITTPGFDNTITDTCDVEISIQASTNKITLERHAKKCDKYKLKQKNQKFELDVSGETLSYKGEEVGSLKDGSLSAEFNIGEIFNYQVSASVLPNQDLQYSETVTDDDFTNSLEVSVEGTLSPVSKK